MNLGFELDIKLLSNRVASAFDEPIEVHCRSIAGIDKEVGVLVANSCAALCGSFETRRIDEASSGISWRILKGGPTRGLIERLRAFPIVEVLPNGIPFGEVVTFGHKETDSGDHSAVR